MIDFGITVHNTLPIDRPAEAVTIGVPFARGQLRDAGQLLVRSQTGESLPTQARAQSHWGDGSIRWAVIYFLGDLKADAITPFRVALRSDAGGNGRAAKANVHAVAPALKLDQSSTRVEIDTGAMQFSIDGGFFRGFERVRVRDHAGAGWSLVTEPSAAGDLYLKDKDGKLFTALWGKVRKFELEDAGPLVCTIRVEGELADEMGAGILEYDLWIRVFAGQSAVRTWLTVRNPRPSARRVLGQWRLGLGGAVHFKEIGWTLTPQQDGVHFVTLHGGSLPHYPTSEDPVLRAGPGVDIDNPKSLVAGEGEAMDELYRGPFTQRAALVQMSSGGKNWFHRSHVNDRWKVPQTYRGFKAIIDGVEARQGRRADGWVALEDTRGGMAIGIRHFWQNFPKGVRAEKTPGEPTRAVAALWPEEAGDLHELQGGEQKTHEMVFHFYRGDIGHGLPVPYRRWPETAVTMSRALNPPTALAEGAHYAQSGAFDHVGLYDGERALRYELANEGSIAARPTNLRTQIEFADQWGWRDFGDTLADNEISGRVLSHYNLEYDMGYAYLIQAIRTADARPDLAATWWKMAEAAVRHESDIDCYHTSADPHSDGAYNHGKHHHTDHGFEAGRGTHRAYDEEGMEGDLFWDKEKGGGPESQHMGNRGMLTYGWMAGYPASIKVAKGLADLVHYKITGDHFPQIGRLYRDSGHNLQILIEGYHLTGDRKYLDVGRHIIDVSHPDTQPWHGGFPFSMEGKQGDGQLITWAGSVFLKEVARFIEVQEAEGQEPDPRAVSALLEAIEYFNKYAWKESTGRFTHYVLPNGEQIEYKEAWWDLKIIDVVIWACEWQKDETKRKLWLSRATRNFKAAGELLTPDGRTPTYHNTKCSTVSAQNGQVFLKLAPEPGGKESTASRAKSPVAKHGTTSRASR